MTNNKENYLEINVGISTRAQWYKVLMKKLKRFPVNRFIRRFHITALFLKDDALKADIKKIIDRELNNGKAPQLTFDKLEAFTNMSGSEHIVCLTSTHPQKEYVKLVEDLRRETSNLGAELEPYRLHVTLARIPVGAISIEDLQKLVAEVPLRKFTLSLSTFVYRYRNPDLDAGLIGKWELAML